MVFVLDYKGATYKVPTCTIRKSEGDGATKNPKIQNQRLTRLKKAIRTYAEESGNPLTSEEIAELIELARDKIPTGYLPISTTQKKTTEGTEVVKTTEVQKESVSGGVKIIKPLRTEAAKSEQCSPLCESIEKFPLGSSRKCFCN